MSSPIENYWTRPTLAEITGVCELMTPARRAEVRARFWLSPDGDGVSRYAQLVSQLYGASISSLYSDAVGHNPNSHDGGFEEACCVKADIEAALASLTDRQRRAIVLHKIQGATQECAAEMMGVTDRALRYSLNAGFRNIGKKLAGGTS